MNEYSLAKVQVAYFLLLNFRWVQFVICIGFMSSAKLRKLRINSKHSERIS